MMMMMMMVLLVLVVTVQVVTKVLAMKRMELIKCLWIDLLGHGTDTVKGGERGWSGKEAVEETGVIYPSRILEWLSPVTNITKLAILQGQGLKTKGQ